MGRDDLMRIRQRSGIVATYPDDEWDFDAIIFNALTRAMRDDESLLFGRRREVAEEIAAALRESGFSAKRANGPLEPNPLTSSTIAHPEYDGSTTTSTVEHDPKVPVTWTGPPPPI